MATHSSSERWAHFRFAVVGPLLAAPPANGHLKGELERLAAKTWQHPIGNQPVQFSFATIERWFYRARRAHQDPVGILQRKQRADAGRSRRLSSALAEIIRRQYRDHPAWSVQLHHDNLAVLVEQQPELAPLPSYATVRRFMRRHGFDKKPRPRPTAGARASAQHKAAHEQRSFESEYANALWHLDFHHGRRKVLSRTGRWMTPILFGVIDDHSRLVPHLQWYLEETAECLVHGLCQALQKYGLPRALMTDNGAAMMASEVRDGLLRLGIVHQPTLPYSPEQNAKQESFWVNVESRLMPMLEGCQQLSLSELNRATCAWLDRDYQRRRHQELSCAPLERYHAAQQVGRDCPPNRLLKRAFTTQVTRRQRRSDGTLSLSATRFELPGRYRHLHEVSVRYARWDLADVELIDPNTGKSLCALFPLDKSANADGRRRRLETPDVAPSNQPSGIAPLLKQQMADYAATGMPPAYLPKDEE